MTTANAEAADASSAIRDEGIPGVDASGSVGTLRGDGTAPGARAPGVGGVSTFGAAIVADNVKKTDDSSIVLDFDPTNNHSALSSSGDGGLVE